MPKGLTLRVFMTARVFLLTRDFFFLLQRARFLLHIVFFFAHICRKEVKSITRSHWKLWHEPYI